jgi:putative ABC transport system permease protein
MINTLKLIYRNFRKNLSINLINLGGLVLSMTVVLMLSAYCYSELRTDAHHPHADQTFLLTNYFQGTVDINTPGVLFDYLKTDISGIQQVVRISNTWDPAVIKHGQGDAFKTELIFADPGFFMLFKYDVIHGNIKEALDDPKSMILMKEEAERIFGSTDVIGEIVLINNKHAATIKAVIDQPSNKSFLSFEAVLPMSSRPLIQPDEGEFTSWTNWTFQTFVQLNENADPVGVGDKVSNLMQRMAGEMGESPIELMPMNQLYFSDVNNGWIDFITLGDKTKVIVLLMVAFLILTIAIINYINISTYSLQERLVQTGIFKILGATRTHIFKNNMLESILIFVSSMWLAIIFAEIFKPFVSHYTGMTYPTDMLLSYEFISISIITAIFLGSLASFWPAISHSTSHPIKNLKKEISAKSKDSALQGSLVIFQFSAAIILITFTLLVHKQIKFGTSNLGFNESNLISIKLTQQLDKDVLKNRLIQETGIKKISLNNFYPDNTFSQWSAELGTNGVIKLVDFNTFDADGQFFDLLGLQLIDGRFFNDTISSDKNKMIVNEAFMRAYGVDDYSTIKINDRFEAIGVVKDFHFKSKNHAIGPLAIMNRGYASMCLVHLKSDNFNDLADMHEKIKVVCAELSPDFPVEVSFMDMAIEHMYQSEVRFRRTFTFFSGCAIFISCLGILALSLFASQRRTKEIGIRKVNGAHMEDILVLLNKDFIKWVIIAFIIATPLAWFSMNKWLEKFAYKTEISWWIFLLGGATALMIALLTVSWQSWNAARRNPVEALRYE